MLRVGAQSVGVGVAWVFSAVLLWGCEGPTGEVGGVLKVDSRPVSGAVVSVGSQVYGETPCEIRGLPSGTVYILFELDGFKSGYETAEIPESGVVSVVAELEPLVGYLSVESEPSHAQVFLDGDTYLGETPLRRVAVVVGEHSYSIRLENHEGASKTFTVEKDYRYSYKHDLDPILAELKVLSRPSGAQIWINEVIQAKTTPARFQLSPGVYTVAAHTKGYIMGEELVELSPNMKYSVDLALQEGELPLGMVLVPAGEFILGTDLGAYDERPKRKIVLAAFYIDKYEVTNAQFKEVFPGHVYSEGLDFMPAVEVTWNQANDYAQRVGKRLPTEAEWEKAARGVDGREFPWGNSYDPELCNGKSVLGSRIKKVGSYRGGVSPFGCMDMAGNVYEWTMDWYQAYEGNTDIVKDYGQVYRVLRGGSYLSPKFDVRCTKRLFDKMDESREDYGFRCASDVVEKTQAEPSV